MTLDSRFLDGGVNGPHENVPSPWGVNSVTLRNRWPCVAEAIAAASIAECASVVGTPYPALAYRGRRIISAYDPIDEAREQAEELDLDAEAGVYCYGIGFGYLPMILAARHRFVHVVIMNLSIARAAFESIEHPWLTDPDVKVMLAEETPILRTPYACVPMECLMADAQGYALRDRLFADLNSSAMSNLVLKKRETRDAQHAEGNVAHTHRDRHVNALFGTRKGIVAIIGGGPTLADSLHWLRSTRTFGVGVIAASSILRTLLENGVTPDVVVTVDSDPANIVQLDGVDLELTRAISLVYHPHVVPAMVAAWQGPRYFLFGGELFLGGTVMHVCADLAVQMGATEVHMVGMDFCYPGGMSHAEGHQDLKEIGMRPTLFEAVDGNGGRVYTDRNLAMYHRNLENHIAKHPDVKWLKHGRAGVSVRGAQWA